MIKYIISKSGLCCIALSLISVACSKSESTTDATEASRFGEKYADNLLKNGFNNTKSKEINVAAQKKITDKNDSAIENFAPALISGAVAYLGKDMELDKLSIVLASLFETMKGEGADLPAEGQRHLRGTVARKAFSSYAKIVTDQTKWSAALSAISKQSVKSITASGIEATDLQETIGEITSELMHSMLDIGVDKDETDNYAAAIVAGEITGVAGFAAAADLKKYVNDIAVRSIGNLDGMGAKTDDQKLQAIFEITSQGASTILNLSGQTHDQAIELCKELVSGAMSALDDAGLSDASLDNAIKTIMRGTLKGLGGKGTSQALSATERLTAATSMITAGMSGLKDNYALSGETNFGDAMRAFSAGATLGLFDAGADTAELLSAADDLAKQATSQLDETELPPEIRIAMAKELAKGMAVGLEESGVSAAAIKDVKDEIATAIKSEMESALAGTPELADYIVGQVAFDTDVQAAVEAEANTPAVTTPEPGDSDYQEPTGTTAPETP